MKKRLVSLILTAAMLLSLLPGSVLAATTYYDGPFSKGTLNSNSFRIPALVTLSDGTLVAAADARWNTTFDGGGLDTAVAWSANNGQSWTSTFANYLGDNGNTYNGSGSTAFLDPALVVTANDTIYMLCDLYPYGVALNGSGNTSPSTAIGFNSEGKLLLSGDDHSSYSYYLDGDTIYNSNGSAVDGYTVDAYFNITGTDGTDSNLFFSDSPFRVVRTAYLYLTTSTNGGQTWSAPTLLNLKSSSEMACLVAPGRGLVTGDGTIIFPCYSFHGDNDPSGNTQRLSFIYCEDGTNWKRSAELNYNWASEAAAIELTDGTLRFFFRNGTTNLCYVDYENDSWGTPVCLNGSNGLITVDTNSNCQISAITYSQQVGGKQVVLVSCPTGDNYAGSNLSSASARLNGKIFAFTIDENGAMTQIGSVALTSQHSDTSYFMYSCLTELSDGSIGILYEDNEAGWGTGDDKYYQMTYAAVAAADLGLSTGAGGENTLTDHNSGVVITVDSSVLTSVSATKKATANTPHTGYTACATYDVVINGGDYTGAAEIRIPYSSEFDGCNTFIGDVGGDTFAVSLVDGYFVGTVPHFSEVDINGVAEVSEEDSISSTTGQTQTQETRYRLATSLTSGGEYLIVNTDSGSGYALNTSKESVAVNINGEYATPAAAVDAALWTYTVETGNKYLSNGSNYLYLSRSGSNYRYTYSLNIDGTKTPVTVDNVGNGAYRVYNSWSGFMGATTRRYVTYTNGAWGVSSSEIGLYFYQKVTENIDTETTVWTVDAALQENRIAALTVANNNYTDTSWTAYEAALNAANTKLAEVKAAQYPTKEDAEEALEDLIALVDALETAKNGLVQLISITITYQTPNGYVITDVERSVADTSTSLTLDPTITVDGKTYTLADSELPVAPNTTTAYAVEVGYLTETVYLSVDGTKTISDVEMCDIVSGLTSSVASAAYNNGTLTITGKAAGEAGTFIANDTLYTVRVVDGFPVTVKVDETLTRSVQDPDGDGTDDFPFDPDTQYIVWSSSDVSHVTAAGVYTSGAVIGAGSFTGGGYFTGVSVTDSGETIPVTALVYNNDDTLAYSVLWLVTVTAGEGATTVEGKTVKLRVAQLENCKMYYSINGGSLQEVGEEGTIIVDGDVAQKWNILIFGAPTDGYGMTHMLMDGSFGEFYTLNDGDANGVYSSAWPLVDAGSDAIDYAATYSNGNNSSIYVTTVGMRWGLAQGNYTLAELKAVYSQALALGCTGVITATKNDSDGLTSAAWLPGGDGYVDLYFVAQELATLKKTLSTNTDDVSIGTKLTYTLTVTIPATSKTVSIYKKSGSTYTKTDYTHPIEYTNVYVTDPFLAEVVSSSDITCSSGSVSGDTWTIGEVESSTTAGDDIVYECTYSITLNHINYAKLVKDGKISNSALLKYTCTTELSVGAETSSSSTEVNVNVYLEPKYILDFGLPVAFTVDLSDYGLKDGVEIVDAKSDKGYADVTIEGSNHIYTVTYTLKKILQGTDIVLLIDNAADVVGSGYSENHEFGYCQIIPASNVLYEEGFMSIQAGSGADWSLSDGTGLTEIEAIQTTVADDGTTTSNVSKGIVTYIDPATGGDGQQSARNAAPYGYDEEYKTSTGASGTQYVANVNAQNRLTDGLTFTFTGTGFDLIGACGPATGTLMVRVDKVNTDGTTSYHKAYLVDTAFEDATYGKIYQVPIVHVNGWDLADYKVTVTGAYVDYNAASAGASSFGLGSLRSANVSALLSHMGLTEAQTRTVEFINLDKSLGFGNSFSTHSGTTLAAAATPETMTLEIDGFRVYRTTVNASYQESVSVDNETETVTGTEYGVTYYNALKAVKGAEFAAYIEGNASGTYTVSNYEVMGGPQNEIYLAPGQAIAFAYGSMAPIQVSLRSVTSDTSVNDDGDGTAEANEFTITHNTELYYVVTPAVGDDGNYYITIENTSEDSKALLAIGNLKFTESLTQTLTASSYNAVYGLLKSGGSKITTPASSDDVILTLERRWIGGSGDPTATVDSDSVSAVYTMKNLLDEENTVSLVVAAYDADGRMLSIRQESITLAALETGTLITTLALPEGTATVKAFLAGDDMRPLCSPMLLPEDY